MSKVLVHRILCSWGMSHFTMQEFHTLYNTYVILLFVFSSTIQPRWRYCPISEHNYATRLRINNEWLSAFIRRFDPIPLLESTSVSLPALPHKAESLKAVFYAFLGQSTPLLRVMCIESQIALTESRRGEGGI